MTCPNPVSTAHAHAVPRVPRGAVTTLTAGTAATITCLANIGRPVSEALLIPSVRSIREAAGSVMRRVRQRSVGDDSPGGDHDSDAASVNTLDAAHDEAVAAMLMGAPSIAQVLR